MTIDRTALRARLLAMKADLEQQDAISRTDRAPVELDQTSVGRLSRIDAMQVQAMALANQQRRRVELDRVAAALVRIDGDDFGYCTVCGDEIAEARISSNPSVVTCIACAR